MPIVKGYKQFSGTHPETGSVRNVLAHLGVKAPHTGKPFSEAMLLGLSGGAAVLYFVFEYKGFPPQLYLGMRNTFEPLETLCKRLKLKTKMQKSDNAAKAEANLLAAFEAGQPAIVWADRFGLPYNAAKSEGFPGTMPLVVFGVEGNVVHIADRARVPLTCTVKELAAARSAQATLKNQMMTLEAPANFDHLPRAVKESLRFCLDLFDGKPPRGPGANFGLGALRKWAGLLTNDKDPKSWARVFKPGGDMYAGLVTAFEYIETIGTGGAASRPQFAAFLDEASVMLNRPALKDAAKKFRASGKKWSALAVAFLPDSIPPFKEARESILRRRELFIEQGNASLAERKQIGERLEKIKATMGKKFPLTDAEAATLRAHIAEKVMAVHEAEKEAVEAMREAS